MERRGNLVYLTPYEQLKTGYNSPINLDEFDLHAERESADAELDRIDQEQSQASDSWFGRGYFVSTYERALARSQLTRNIGKSVARDTLILEGIAEIEEFLQDPDV